MGNSQDLLRLETLHEVGQYLYFFPVSSPRELHLKRLRMADRRVEEVARIVIPEEATGLEYPWMSLAPDGSLLLARDASVREIYALDIDLP